MSSCAWWFGSFKARGLGIIILTVLVVASVAQVQSSLPPHEHAALVDLFETCSGVHWGILFTSTWLRTNEVCGVWAGIECSNVWHEQEGSTSSHVGNTTHVVGLTLAHVPLNCELPASLASLVYLRSLDLTGSHLHGQRFPEVLRAFFYLQSIRLADTHLTGSLPSWLQRMRDVRFLDISDNAELYGIIPPSYAALSNVSVFLARNTSLHGELPFFLQNVPEWDLRASTSQFNGPCPPPAWVWKGIHHTQLTCPVVGAPLPSPPLGIAPIGPAVFLPSPVAAEPSTLDAAASKELKKKQEEEEIRKEEKAEVLAVEAALLEGISGGDVWSWNNSSNNNNNNKDAPNQTLATRESNPTGKGSHTVGVYLLVFSMLATLAGISYSMRRVSARSGYTDLNDARYTSTVSVV